MTAEKKLRISSARFDLIPFDAENFEHCSFLVTLWNTPLFVQSCGKTSITTPAKAKELIERRFLAEYERNGYGTYLISLKSHAGEELGGKSTLVGTVSLTRGDSADFYSVPDLGFAVLPEMTGKGIATEASSVLMEWAEEERGVQDVFGFCDPESRASRKVLEKAGFEFRGVRELAAFGGVEASVYALPHMDKNLMTYGVRASEFLKNATEESYL